MNKMKELSAELLAILGRVTHAAIQTIAPGSTKDSQDGPRFYYEPAGHHFTKRGPNIQIHRRVHNDKRLTRCEPRSSVPGGRRRKELTNE